MKIYYYQPVGPAALFDSWTDIWGDGRSDGWVVYKRRLDSINYVHPTVGPIAISPEYANESLQSTY